jgi:hypothetical protein
VAETRRVCNASRLEMWLRCSTWLHLHFPYGCAAQLLRMGAAFGAMPHLSAVEPDLAAPTAVMFLDAASILCLTSVGRANTDEHWPFDDPQLRPNASWPTSGSRSSTSGRRSTSRRSALTPRWTPERARLPRPACLAPARVTVACACVRPAGVNRSRPFPRCGGGRGRSVSWGAGASPTAAHWAVAEQSTKVRSSPRASNSPHFCLILTFCLLLLPLSGPVCALQHLIVAPTRRQAHPQRPCRPPGRSRSRSRRRRACSWARRPPAASIGRSLWVVIFRV